MPKKEPNKNKDKPKKNVKPTSGLPSKYTRKTAKNNVKPVEIDLETLIGEKLLKGISPTEEELQIIFERYGFKDGDVPEPEEGDLSNFDKEDVDDDANENAPQQPPPQITTDQKPKKCPKGTRRNKNGDCMPNNTKKGKIVIHAEPPPPVLRSIPDAKREEYNLTPENFVRRSLIVPEKEKGEDKKRAAKTAMNRFLDEKEKLERDHPLEHHEYLYPDLNDPNFNIKIALKKEFQDAQYDGEIRDIERQADLLCRAKFELSTHQVFVKNYLSSDTPYKGLLLYHGLGTGKTCSAIGVAEEMRQYMKRTGLKQQILVVASPNVQGNFRQQLFDERKLTKVTNVANPNEFSWNIESCVGNSLLNEINPNSIRNLSREKLISNINSLINENYAFLGYIQFANVARARMMLNAEHDDPDVQKEHEKNNIRKFFDERFIIIDEVHNIRLADDSNRKELQQVAAVLMKVVKYARGLRLLLLSATPMFNSYREIIWITNLLNANDGRSQIQTSDVFNADGTERKGNKDEESGLELLRRKLTGYVSYVRGENPYTFPYRLYPSVFSPENALNSFAYPRIQMNGIEIDSPIQNINVYVNRVERTTYQSQVYLSIIDYMRRKTQGFYTNAGIYREMPSFENMESFGYTLLQRPLESLNISYPNEDITEMFKSGDKAAHYTDELFQNAVGGTGLAKIVSFTDVENDEPLKHDYEYLPGPLKKYGRIFSPEELPKYSAKMAEICKEIRRSEGIVLIYSQYIDGGVVPMALALEEMGLSRYSHSLAGRHRHLFKRAPTASIDALKMVPKTEMAEGDQFYPAQYIMITGDRGLSPSNTEDVKYATNADNIDGKRVKVIIISKAGSEGLDFKAIRQVHILEPWFNMNRIEQIIGRGVRNLSHCALPFKKRNVQIYLHSTLIDGVEEEAADLYLYRLAERKAVQIGKVSRVIKESAADCILNIGQTNFTAERLSSLAANQNIRLELSSREFSTGNIREVDFRIGDLDGSEICDYMSCDYQCRPKLPKSKQDEDNTQSYNEHNIESNIYYIIGRIKDLFRERHVYTLSQICAAINVVRIYPIVQIYYVLTKFANNRNMLLFDKYGRFGYLINRAKYYEFQPVEITDERVSIRERSVPVEYKRSNIILQLPEKDQKLQKDRTPRPAAAVTDKGQEVSEFDPASYEDTIHEIRECLDMVGKQHAIKSTEMNWYKNTSRAIEHLHIVYQFTEEDIKKYVIFHYLDSANYQVKRTLFEATSATNIYEVDPEIETHVASYFSGAIMRSKSGDKEGIYIANREDVVLIYRDTDGDKMHWKEGDKFDAEDFVANNLVDKKALNDIVGYMIQFKDQDISFYYKDIHLTRNKKGRRCDRSGGKAPIIDMLNRVTGSNVKGKEMYSEANTSTLMYSGSLCVVLEMLLRKFNDDKKSQKIYYLTPEQAIQSKITDYSAAAR